MKYLKLTFATLALFVFISCDFQTSNSPHAPHPDFKIGRDGLENILKQEFNFQKMSVGTHMSSKMGLKELGLNLTFQKEDLMSVSDSLLKTYSTKIKKTVIKNLLYLEDYDYLNITFENQFSEGAFTKSTATKIREQLKPKK
ncbi:MAG: hypothetical protein ACJA1B_002251 [Polaribacter sp.]|jgi:hypothetical protein